MKLTANQEKFAQLIAEGYDQSNAYRGAYNVSEKTKNESIWTNASKLMNNTKVMQRVEELKQKTAKKHEITVDNLITELEEARKCAIDNKQTGSAVSATMGKAKLAGLDKQIIEQETTIIIETGVPRGQEN